MCVCVGGGGGGGVALLMEESDGPESADVALCPLVPEEGIRNVKCGPKLPAELRAEVGQWFGVFKGEPYLYSQPFTLETDHQPLKYLQSAKLSKRRLMRWSLLLQPFQFTVRVIPGRDNVGADYLSRALEAKVLRLGLC